MSFRLIKFFNKDTEEWQTVAVCEDKGEKGDKGDPFRFEDFTPEQLEVLKGTVFTPYQDEEGRLNWENNGGLENPLPMDFTGPQGEPFEYKDFTPEQLEGLRGPRGYHLKPSLDNQCNLSWSISTDTEDIPDAMDIRSIVYSSEQPTNTSALWVVEEEDSGNVGKDVVTSNSVNRIEIVEGDYPKTLEENVLYIKVK